MRLSRGMVMFVELQAYADTLLGRRLIGEDPDNEPSTWSRRAAVGMDVFRTTIWDMFRSVAHGRMTEADAMELLGICDRGLQAFLDLNE